MKQTTKKAILEFFMPTVACCVCGEKTDLVYKGLCRHCLAELLALREAYAMCDFCGNFYGRQMVSCPYCFEKKERRAYQKVESCFPYKDTAKNLVAVFKFQNGKYLAATMARLMTEGRDLAENGLYEAIAAVPMTKKSQRRRGYNQSRVLAQELSLLTGLPLYDKLLEKIKETENQASLSGTARRENLRGAYRAAAGFALEGRSLLLVDDVITTGSTAHNCALALKKAGAKQVKVCTFCGAGQAER